jgi:hypothetical protein
LQPESEEGVSNLDFAFSQQAMRQAATPPKNGSARVAGNPLVAEKHHWTEKGWAKGGAPEAKASSVPMLKALRVESGTPLMEAVTAAGKQ